MSDQNNSEPPTTNDYAHMRDQYEYNVAWELETWRQAETERFKAQLMQTEMEMKRSLQARYEERVAELETRVAAALGDVEAERTRLRSALTDAERVRAAIRVQHTDLTRQRIALTEEYETKVSDCAQTVARSREDALAKIAAERAARAQAQARAEWLEKELADAVSRRRNAEDELVAVRKEVATGPDADLVAEARAATAAAALAEKKAREAVARAEKAENERDTALRLLQKERKAAAERDRERASMQASSLANGGDIISDIRTALDTINGRPSPLVATSVNTHTPSVNTPNTPASAPAPVPAPAPTLAFAPPVSPAILSAGAPPPLIPAERGEGGVESEIGRLRRLRAALGAAGNDSAEHLDRIDEKLAEYGFVRGRDTA